MSTLARSVDAEYLLLGALAMDNKRIDAVADIVEPEDFYEPFFGHIFGCMVSEYSQGRAANPVTLRPMLAGHPNYSEVGGDSFLAGLVSSATAATPALESARLIARTAKRRRLVEGLSESIAAAGDPETSLESVADVADHAIVAALEGRASATEITGADCVNRLLKSFEQPTQGVKSHVVSPMDDLLGPVRPKQLVILAARPGMGKTATALSYALGAAQAGHGVLFVSLEMGGEELAGRMAADLSFDGRNGVPLDDILCERPDRRTVAAVAQAGAMLADMPFNVVDTGKLTIGRLAMIVRRYARRMAAKGQKLDLVMVDYLQLLSVDGKGRSAYETVSEISRGLKQIAKDAGVGVIALAQLSREVEKRTDKRPQLSDLRDSGQIEQDADAVVFLVRQEYYLRQAEPERDSPERLDWEQAIAAVENQLEFVCAKRRNGRTGTAFGHFYTRFQAVRA